MTRPDVFVPLQPAFRKLEVSGIVCLGYRDEVSLALGEWAPGGMVVALTKKWRGTSLREISAWLRQYLKDNFLTLSDLWATEEDAQCVVSPENWKTTLSDVFVEEGFPKIRCVEGVSPGTRAQLWDFK